MSQDAVAMTVITLGVILGIRNWFVWRFLGRLLEIVRQTGIEEIENNDFQTYQKRSRQLHEVGYLELVLVFWKPFRSFFTGKDLLEPLVRKLEDPRS